MLAWRDLLPTCESCIFLKRRRTVAESYICNHWLRVGEKTWSACGAYLHRETLESLREYLRRAAEEKAEGGPYR